MKKNILILFAVVSLLISLTGCGSSGVVNSVAPTTETMTSVRISLTQNGQAATNADVALYTPSAAMREGLTQAQNNTSFRASIGNNNSEGVYSPDSRSKDGIYNFNVPTGEYTLIATKGSSRAVVTTIRAEFGAEEGSSSPVGAVLLPTGTIEGKVSVDSANSVSLAGAIAYLENTSFVAFTDSDGKFTLTGVPIDTGYNIAAVLNYNGKLYTTSNTTTVNINSNTSGLVYPLPSDLTLKANDSYLITGSITGNDISSKVVMASKGNSLALGVSKDDGTFEIPVNSKGSYTVTCIGATEPTQEINVVSKTNALPSTFSINNNSDVSYGCVKGNIQISSEYFNTAKNSNMPDVDKYLVRLIGTGTTYYCSSTKADYKYVDAAKTSNSENDTIATFSFGSVPPGDYVILVDPAGNGFLGSAGKITVTANNTNTVEPIAVEFVKPEFFVKASPDSTLVFEKFPFGSSVEGDTFAYCRKLNGGEYNSGIINLSNLNNGSFLMYNPNNYILPSNGKFEIIVLRKWFDSNTGLSGTLTGTQIVDYDKTTGYLGEIEVKYLENTNNELNNQNATYTAEIYYETGNGGVLNEYIHIKKKGDCIATLTYPTELEELTPQYLYNVQVFNNGGYYFEASSPDGDEFRKFIFIYDGEDTYKSLSLINRINCVMDKYGFMYRYDEQTNRLIKIDSIEGKTIEYIDSSISSMDQMVGGVSNTIGLDLTDNTLYYWKYQPIE